MANPNRGSLLGKLHKVLRKHYKPQAPAAERPVLEQLLFACCLENARYEAAEQAFAALSTAFFDWNEVRVSTVKELSEVMHALPDPAAAAMRLKRTLQSAFEATYSFELEALKKQNIGQAIGRLKKLEGSSPFAVAYVTQTALGGHAIPLDRGALDVLAIIGAATPAETESGEVAGLERAIPKNKGVEFGSLLHQLAAELVAGPYAPAVHAILLEVTPDAKERLPKRHAKKPAKPELPPAKAPPAAATKKSAGKAPAEKPAAEKAAAAKASDKAHADKAGTHKKRPDEPKKKPPAKAPALAKKQKPPPLRDKKTAAAKLAKRKPR